MIWLFIALSVVTTFVIAAVSVGGVTARLASRSRRSVYDLDEAVEWVADHLPETVSAQVSYADVRAVLGWYVDYLEATGVASGRTADDPGSGLILVGDDEPVAYVLGRIDDVPLGEPGSEVTDDQAAAILATNLDYEQAIGAIGPEVTPPRP